MADVFTKEKRSAIMGAIRSEWTGPEKHLHGFLKSRHVRHRMHPEHVPGRPDALVFPGVAVFVDGCFWHGCPRHWRLPKTHKKFWSEKVGRNMARDLAVDAELKKKGFIVERMFECDIKDGFSRLIKGLK